MEARRVPRELDVETGAVESPLHAERVALTLEQLQQSQQHLQEMESRLSALTRECAAILEQWNRTDERHASALASLQERLNGWNDLERRLLTESAARLQQFERNALHEWHVIRQRHEEPILRLDAQATRIRDTCLEAVDSALKGFDRAEARLAALEESLQTQFDDLTRELRSTVAALHGGEHAARPLGARPWALDEVVRLHGQIRAEADDRGGLALAGRSAAAEPPAADRSSAPPAEAAPAGEVSWWRRPSVLLTAAIVAVALVAGYVWLLQQQLHDGLTAAATRAEAAERSAANAEQARASAAEVQRAADQRLRAAEEAALAAQRTAGVMTAPDMVRLDFVARSVAPRARGHLLWSRTRGSVLSGGRLPALPSGQAFQLWLQTRQAPISAGTFRADESGTVSATFDAVDDLPRPVIGAWVSIEPGRGSESPTGPVVLTTLPDAPSTP